MGLKQFIVKDVVGLVARNTRLRFEPWLNIYLPYYHIAADSVAPHLRHVHDNPPVAKFRAHVDYLAQHFRPMSVEEVIACVESGRGPAEPSFHISFDDGLREVYDIIAPILIEKGIPASVYVNSAAVDNRKLLGSHLASVIIEKAKELGLPPDRQDESFASFKVWALNTGARAPEQLDEYLTHYGIDVAAYLQTERPYMTRDEILDLAAKGFYVGGHTHDHIRMPTLDLDAQKEQVSKSLQYVRDDLGLPGEAFAFPYSDANISADLYAHMEQEGVRLSFGTASPKRDHCRFSLQRFSAGVHNNLEFREILTQQAIWSMAARLLGKTEISRPGYSKQQAAA